MQKFARVSTQKEVLDEKKSIDGSTRKGRAKPAENN
jgi:hypothetical protein